MTARAEACRGQDDALTIAHDTSDLGERAESLRLIVETVENAEHEALGLVIQVEACGNAGVVACRRGGHGVASWVMRQL